MQAKENWRKPQQETHVMDKSRSAQTGMGKKYMYSYYRARAEQVNLIVFFLNVKKSFFKSLDIYKTT